MAEALSSTEVGQKIAEHDEAQPEHGEHSEHAERHRLISIIEAILLSLVALLAAWSGYSAAKWGTEASLSLAHSAATRSKASVAQIQALQIRTLDSVSFNALETAYAAHNARLSVIAFRRLRPGYKPAVKAWLATHPLTNPHAPAGPAYMPEYHIPQQAQGRLLDREASAYFTHGESSADTEDKYVRLTVLLAAVLFLIGIGSRFPVLPARYGLITVAGVLLVISVVQLLSLPGPPS